MRFSRQEYWSGLPSPSPGDLPDPGFKPRSPALQADALTSQPPQSSVRTWPHPSVHLLPGAAGVLGVSCATCSAQLHPTLRPQDCSPPGSPVHGDSPGKKTGVGCHALLQGISPPQGSSPGLPLREDSVPSERPGKPTWRQCQLSGCNRDGRASGARNAHALALD